MLATGRSWAAENALAFIASIVLSCVVSRKCLGGGAGVHAPAGGYRIVAACQDRNAIAWPIHYRRDGRKYQTTPVDRCARVSGAGVVSASFAGSVPRFVFRKASEAQFSRCSRVDDVRRVVHARREAGHNHG